MSIENISKNQICDDQLEKVSGGDYGDIWKECSDLKENVKPLYKVGDRVEVYNTCFHSSTKTGVVRSIRIGFQIKSGHFPVYTVYVYEDNETIEVTSADIES